MSTTIVLADDHGLVRQALRALLSADPSFTVIGEAADGLEAIAVVERTHPSVLIVDLMMPGLGGVEVIRRVAHSCPQTKTIVLSMFADEPHVLEASHNGASGYALKESDSAELIHAIHEVVAGRRYLSPSLAQQAIEVYLQHTPTVRDDLYETLTPREREILHLAAEGLSNKEIAARLVISPRTVEVHRSHLMRKAGFSNQADLVRYAVRRGILPQDR